MDKVKTIICHHNYQDFLFNSIISAINQTYRKNEFHNSVCVIDDKSNNQDSVKDICDKSFGHITNTVINTDYTVFNYQDGNQCILMNKNKGPSAARNIGISENINDNDYFTILDADDRMINYKIDEMLSIFKEFGSNIGVVYGDYIIVDEKGNKRIEYKKRFDIKLLQQECIVHSGAMISKQALLDVRTSKGFYNEDFRVCEDFQLWLRISSKYMIYHIPEVLSIVNDHINNSSNSVSKEVWVQHWQKIRDSLND